MRSIYWLAILHLTLLSATGGESPAPARDRSHDFDFLIGNWKAHVRRLPDRFVGSNTWIEYNGISNHKSFSIAMRTSRSLRSIIPRNTSTSKARHLGYTIPTRINGVIYLLDLDKGVLSVPPVVGEFNGNRGEFYDQGTVQRARGPGALCLAKYLTKIGADGAILLA
jgi:hypothetical protein